jgi:hypothetical protein
VADIQTAQPRAAAQTGITQWRRIVEELDWDRLHALRAEQVTYRSPADLPSHHGKDTMVAILRAVFSVLQDFTYLRPADAVSALTSEVAERTAAG